MRFSLLIVKFVLFAQTNAPSQSVELLQSIAVILKMRLTFLLGFFMLLVLKKLSTVSPTTKSLCLCFQLRTRNDLRNVYMIKVSIHKLMRFKTAILLINNPHFKLEGFVERHMTIKSIEQNNGKINKYCSNKKKMKEKLTKFNKFKLFL